MDLSAAFDSVNHIALLYKLTNMGFTGRILGWLQSYLSDRKFQTLYRGKLSKIEMSKSGVPQGGILSPFLFNALMSDLPRLQDITMTIFADDIAVCATGIDVNRVVSKLQHQLNLIQKWCLEWGQRINPSKTKGMHFYDLYENSLPISVNGINIEYVNSFKFLGITLDAPKLDWHMHLNKLKFDCNKRINLLKSISHHHWGADKKTLLMLYKTLIRSKLDYGCQFYNGASRTLLNPLEVIQNQSLASYMYWT